MRIANCRTARTACQRRALPIAFLARTSVAISSNLAFRRKHPALQLARTHFLPHASTIVQHRALGTKASFATVKRIALNSGAA